VLSPSSASAVGKVKAARLWPVSAEAMSDNDSGVASS